MREAAERMVSSPEGIMGQNSVTAEIVLLRRLLQLSDAPAGWLRAGEEREGR